MSRGTLDDDDEDDDAPIEITPEIIEGDSLEADTASHGQPTFTDAGRTDPRADLTFYLDEVALIEGPGAAPLIHEIGHLQESALGDDEAALGSYRRALERDPAFVATLGPLRRIFAARGMWNELCALFDEEIRSAPLGARDRADLWVERGRLLEDRLGRPADAAASYRAGLEQAPDHPPALLALLLLSARAGDKNGVEAALVGLARQAENPERRAALSVELARVQRRPAVAPPGAAAAAVETTVEPPAEPPVEPPVDGATGPERALATVRAALAAAGPLPPPAALLRELAELGRLRDFPRVQIDALDELLRHAPAGAAALEVALHREKARLLRDVIRDPQAAFQALASARRLVPEHPLVTTEMLDIADQLGRVELIADLMSEMASPADSDAAVTAAGTGAVKGAVAGLVIARFVEALGRAGRAAEALQVLSRQVDPAPADRTLFAVRIALLAETGDAGGLAEAFEAEGEAAGADEGLAAAHALVRAATLREIALQEQQPGSPRAEALYRRALARHPGYPPAMAALEEKLRGAARWRELGELLESDLTTSYGATPARQRYLLGALVGLHRDRLDDPTRALEFQRRLVALDPDALRAWAGRYDLELDVSLRAGADGRDARRTESVETLLELAARAGHPGAAVALRDEAARLSAGASSAGDEARARAATLYRGARSDPRGGQIAGGLEASLDDPSARMDAVSSELDAAVGAGAPEISRALRFRLAFQHARARQWKPAVASLRPLVEAGDAVARAWSYDLARRSGDAGLVVATLTQAAGAPAGAADAGSRLEAPADRGEALERLGDVAAAEVAFRDALRPVPAGEPAPGAEPRPSIDTAVGLFRTAASARPANLAGVVEALRAIGAFSPADPTIAAAARREADLIDAARGEAVAPPSTGAGPTPTPDDAVLGWLTGLRGGDQGRVAEALADLAGQLERTADGRPAAAATPLLLRAAARSRLADRQLAETIHRRAWSAAPGAPALAHALADLYPSGAAAGDSGDPAAIGLPDTRAARAQRVARSGAAVATALDLERGLDHEKKGELGKALDVYGQVLARDPGRLDAMEGVRRVARAGGDVVGEARALMRLGALVKTPARAGALFAAAGPLYERVGHVAGAIVAYFKVLELVPDDEPVFQRLLALLRAAADEPGNAKALDRLLGHRLQHRLTTADGSQLMALYAERAHNRLLRLEDREGAAEDFKRILKIDPGHADSLRQLATLAIEMRYPADAARLLEEYLAVARDADLAAAARLELAEAYENAQDRPSAAQVLKKALALDSSSAVAAERLADLSLRMGDWRGSVEALRAWEAAIADPLARARLQLRIGTLLRDEGYDVPAAALAFRRAAELDPLGDGTAALSLLFESAGDQPGRQKVLEHAIFEMRQTLARDPLDVPRLHRLKELLEATAHLGNNGQAAEVVMETLALLGEAPPLAALRGPPGAPRALAGPVSSAFWSTLADPRGLGFMAEIWPLLADAARELHPLDAAALGAVRQNRIAAGAEPRLGWVEKTALALGLPGVLLHLVPHPAAAGDGAVIAIELPEPALLFGAGALAGDGATAFWFGQALGLLRQRAGALRLIAPADLQTIFMAAGIVAGAPSAAGTGKPADLRSAEAQAKALGKALARKDRKALALQASRFGFEAINAEEWQRAVLRTADRLGLVCSGDLAASVRALGRFSADVSVAMSVFDLRRNPAVVDLLRFALSEAYLALRQEAGRGAN